MIMRPVRTVVLLPLVGALLAGCNPEEQAAAPARPAPVVEVMTVHPVSQFETRRFTGTIQPRRTVVEAFRVGGEILERPVEIGDRVRRGDLIARLDPADFDLTLAKAAASLEAARTNRDRAAADERRGADLRDRGHASSAEYDGRALELAEAEARLSAAEKELELARNQRRYTELLASADGLVSSVSAEPGQVVAAGTPVVAIAAAADPEVLAAIPESQIAGLDDVRAEVSLWAGGRTYSATLRELSPTADPATRTYAARFALDEPDEAARFGMTASVVLYGRDPEAVIRIPPTALHDEGRGPVVYVLSGSAVVQTPVEVRRYESDAVLIGADLQPGTRIVTLGVNRLENGQTVRLAPGTDALAAFN